MKYRLSAFMLFVLCLARPVQAEDDSAVRDLVSKINDYLSRMKDSLSGIVDDTSQSAVDKILAALESARQLRSTAKELADKHPESDPARTMAERYSDYADRFLRSGEALRDMKRIHNNQFGAGLTHRCEEAERKLKEESSRYLERNDPEGIQKLPELAERLGQPLAQELADEDRRKSEISNLKSTARDFSESHGSWADVRDKLRDGAEAISDRWTRVLDEEHRACDELAKQKQHREVIRALEKLSQNGEVRGQIIRELDETLDRIHSLVRNLQERSGDSEISSASDLADKLSEILGKLANAKGGDARANAIVDKWPGYVSDYRNSARALNRLKQYQRTLDRAPEQCGKRTNDLRAALQKSSEGAGREAKRLALECADYVKDHLPKADASRSEIQSFRDAAKRFSADDGKWREVSRAMQASADAVLSYWEGALRSAHEQCDDLALGLASRQMSEGNGMAYSRDDHKISDCTENEKRVHQDDIEAKCKGAGKKSCDALKVPRECDEIRYRYDEARVCLQARQYVIKECFSNNTLTTHQTAMDQVTTYMNGCKSKLDTCP